jgi:hypothetical protein
VHGQTDSQEIIASPFYYYQRWAFLKPSLFNVRCTGKLIASNHRQPILLLPTAGIFETVVVLRALHGQTDYKNSVH